MLFKINGVNKEACPVSSSSPCIFYSPYSSLFLLRFSPPPFFFTPPIPPFRSPCFLLPLCSLVQWWFNDAVIHSCSRHCLMVMWPKPAWQHGEQHSSVFFVCVCVHTQDTHMLTLCQANTHRHTSHARILSSFSQFDKNSSTLMHWWMSVSFTTYLLWFYRHHVVDPAYPDAALWGNCCRCKLCSISHKKCPKIVSNNFRHK